MAPINQMSKEWVDAKVAEPVPPRICQVDFSGFAETATHDLVDSGCSRKHGTPFLQIAALSSGPWLALTHEWIDITLNLTEC
jgi:hypothetical protein